MSSPRLSRPLPRSKRRPWPLSASLALTTLLAACGGGGGSGSTGSAATAASAAASGTPTSTTTTSTASPDPSTLPVLTLRGVAAVGAPLGGAALTVIDATGLVVGTGSTRLADGGYSINLSSKSPAGPLLVQARGVDAAGQPQLLHSSVTTPAVAMVANITPLSDAAVALALGQVPARVFANAASVTVNPANSSGASPLTRLAQTTLAANFVKTLVKLPLGDLKITSTTLDLLADPAFAADKSPADLLLEGLRVKVTTSAAGADQLQLTSKLQIALTPEVVVDLAAAQAELVKAGGGSPANAIVSTTKATASYAAVLPNLARLDELSAALNQLIALGSNEDTLGSSALLAGYDTQDGRSGADLTGQLAGFATHNWQLGRLQVMGCADAVQTKGNCAKVQVAALVSDRSGEVRGQFRDVVSYSKTSTAGQPPWRLVGNGQALDFKVQPMAWLDRGDDGVPVAGDNPRLGVALLLRGRDKNGHATFTSATVQTPGGFSIALADCDQTALCLASQGGATAMAATGMLDDVLLRPVATGWLGGGDTLAGARFLALATNDNGSFSRTALLAADLPTTLPATTRFVTLDGVGAGAPLTGTWLANGLDLAWATWAKAHPEMRVHDLRVVIRQTDRVEVQAWPVLPGITSLTLPDIVPQDDQATLDIALWLYASDTVGRAWVTRYSILP